MNTNHIEELIKKFGNDNRYWYIDVLGMTADGRNSHYVSGNIMKQGECGYGGFHTYQECRDILEHFNERVKYNSTSIKNNSSEGFDTIVPLRAIIFFSPLELTDNVYIESIVL